MSFKRKTAIAMVTIGAIAACLMPPGAKAQSMMGRGFDESKLESLDLTIAQQEEIQSIRTQHEDQMAEILTADQYAELKAALDAGKSPRSVVMSMGITRAQMGEMRSLGQSTQSRIASVLSEDQREQLDGGTRSWEVNRDR
ncbi:MAG: Spy/CpxP family protein refolding chaperone [Cyanobacteria bacterium J06639_1]